MKCTLKVTFYLFLSKLLVLLDLLFIFVYVVLEMLSCTSVLIADNLAFYCSKYLTHYLSVLMTMFVFVTFVLIYLPIIVTTSTCLYLLSYMPIENYHVLVVHQTVKLRVFFYEFLPATQRQSKCDWGFASDASSAAPCVPICQVFVV